VMQGGADLHMHSRHSDGTDEPARIVVLAAAAGLQAVSLTDHDSIDGLQEASEAGKRLGVRVIAGAELSAEFQGHEVHLLAYGFDPLAPALRRVLQEVRRARARRIARMVEQLNQLGIPLTMSMVGGGDKGVALGRPHVADALVRTGAVATFQEAFDRYLNQGRPAFVPRALFSLASVRTATVESGGALVLAHPHLNLSSGNIHALVDSGIDGLETAHPRLKPSQSRELAKLAEERGLLATGGSDYHGERRELGRVGSVRVSLEIVDRIAQVASRRAGESQRAGLRVGERS